MKGYAYKLIINNNQIFVNGKHSKIQKNISPFLRINYFTIIFFESRNKRYIFLETFIHLKTYVFVEEYHLVNYAEPFNKW